MAVVLHALVAVLAAPADGQRLVARHYGIHDGLPSPQVRAVTQGDDGRLWIAGPAGVAVYDGTTWQEFGLSAGLRWGDQTALVWDDSGRLVSVSHRAPYPASRRRGESWTQLETPPDAALEAVLLDVAASPEGALVYATDRGLFLGRPSGWTRMGTEDGLFAPMVRSLAVWRGGLALATDHGVFHLSDGRLTPLIPPESLPSARVLALVAEDGLEDADSDQGRERDAGEERLWLVGEGWIGSWRPSWGRSSDPGSDPASDPSSDPASELERFATGLAFRSGSAGPVRALADGLGGLYLCGVEATASWVELGTRESGLVYFHSQIGLQPLGAAEGIGAGRVEALFRDREDNVWVGGERGLTKIVSGRFRLWDRRLGLLDDAVYSAVERSDGSVVLGHRGGVSVLRRQNGHTTMDTRSLPLTSPDQRRIEPVRDLVEDDDGVLWLAAESAGVLALPTLVSEPRRYASAVGGSDNGRQGSGLEGNATALAASGRKIWVGTDQGAFLSLGSRSQGGRDVGSRGSRRTFFPVAPDSEIGPEAGPIHVRQMEADGDAVMVATAQGVYRFEASGDDAGDDAGTGRGRFWRCAADGACNSVFGLLRRSETEWWLGTAAGVFRIDLRDESDQFQPVEIGGPATVEEPVFFLVESEDQGAIWLGTGNGALRLSRGSKLERFSVEDGLAGRETNRAAAFFDRDGRLWMGTDGGISVYDPRFDRPTRRPPVVELLAVEAGGEIYDPNEELRLPADADDLIFRFRAVSLIDEDRVLLRRRLEGEEEWSEPFQGRGELRYPNLQAGTYQLRLQAAGAAGTWSEPAVSARIVVRAPFWSTPWFLIALTLTAGCLTWGLVTLVSQRRYFHRLRQEVAERTSELQASEDRYRKTFKAIDDGVVATDGEGRVQLLNPTAQRLTGWSEEEARGKPVEEVMNVYYSRASDLSSDLSARGRSARVGPAGVEEGLAMSAGVQNVAGAGVPGAAREDAVPKGEKMSLLGDDFTDTIGPTHTAVMESRDGKRRHIEMSTSPIASRAHGVTGLVFAFRDVTRRRRIEEELSRTQKLEAVGILAGGIAHDFNNLLTVLMGNLSLIHDSVRLDPDTAKALADAETALVRARDLTQQLLTFSRGGAPVRETASVSEVLRDSASFVLRGSKVRFDLDLAEGLWLVDIDAGQISQVMQNLLLNADQAMPSGGTVYITARNVGQVPASLGGRSRAARGRFVRIDVRDDGHGIPSDLQMRVFDPYFSTKEEGRGLGLASAYAIVKKHDGLLTVRSSPGRGTTFSIYLPGSPQGLREGTESRPSGPLPPGGLPQFEGRRVLLMDDDRAVRRTAGAMLERLGCQVVHADNGAKALALYEEAHDDGRRFDAVLMDLTVPGGMGGQEAVVRLRALDETAIAIVYSGYSTDPVLAEYTEYGFDGRLSKPFRIRELAAVLEEVLGKPEPGDSACVDAQQAMP